MTRGGEKTEAEQELLGKKFRIEEHRSMIARKQDGSIYETGVKPIPFARLRFDGQQFAIPAQMDAKKEPEWTPVPQGVMDIYFGNVSRLESKDARERSEEIGALRNRFRHDPCIRFDMNGKNTNEYGFLEFKREIIQPMNIAVDSDHIYSDQYIEI